MEGVDITVERIDALCRGVKALAEMVEEGVVVASVEFPIFHTGRDEEVTLKVQAFRCNRCEDIHVQMDLTPATHVFGWDKERSDERLFGDPSE